MGIIVKQSAKNLVTTYLGFGIGAVNTLFLYTNFLQPEYYGLVSFLLSAAGILWPLLAFGVSNSLVKFYSSYADARQQDGLLNMALVLPLVVALVVGSFGIIFYQQILDYFAGGNELVQDYVWLIYVMALGSAYFEVFFSWAKVHYKSVFGNFMKEVFQRLAVSVLLMAVYFGWLTVEEFVYWLSGIYLLRAFIMKLYAFSLRLPRLSRLFPLNWIPVLKYSSLILIAGSVAMILLDLDKVMIEYYLPIENVAIYSIAIYIASVIGVPSKAMHQITYPLTAILINEKDRPGLRDLYRKSSISLLVISGLIFILVISNLSGIYSLIPKQYELPFVIVVLVASVKLYDNLLGNNNSILFNSDYYRLVLWTGVMLAGAAFLFNIIFIPAFGLIGAALATFLAFFLYNTVKLFIVYQKFGIHPFSKKTFLGLICIAVFSAGFSFWDFRVHPFLNIILKSLLIVVLYLPLIRFLNLSPDMNRLITQSWEKISGQGGKDAGEN